MRDIVPRDAIDLPKSDWFLSLAMTGFRLLGSRIRGKTRLANALLVKKWKERPTVVRDNRGNRFLLPNLMEPVALSVWLNGCYEPQLLTFVDRYVTPGSVLLDVGANIGVFTIPFARRAAKVVALEASPLVAPYLKKNIELNSLSNVTVVECAASAGEQDSIPFYLPPMTHFGMGSSAPQFHVDPICIPAVSVDSVLHKAGISRVAAMKVDVEGFEAEVFAGAKELLSTKDAPKIVFEFCDWAEQRAFPGYTGRAQEVLLGHGYRLWRLDDYLNGKAPLEKPLRKGFDSVVGIPPGQN